MYQSFIKYLLVGDISGFMVTSAKVAVFWDVVPCSLLTDISEVFTASIITAMSKAPLKHQTVSTRLHGATPQKTTMFIC
jgi:hypothetical protein